MQLLRQHEKAKYQHQVIHLPRLSVDVLVCYAGDLTQPTRCASGTNPESS